MKKSYIPYLKNITIIAASLLPMLAGAQVSVGVQATPPTCHGFSNGEAQALPQGGAAPYAFSWSNNQTGQTAYGLGAGTYHVTVTDAVGATAVGSATLAQPDSLVALVFPMNGLCNGNTGDFTALAVNSTPPLSFQWSNGETGQVISNPDTGYVYVSITDSKGCYDVGGLKIAALLEVYIHTEDVLCPGDCDGSAEAIISGGVGPYSVQWNTGGTTQVIHPLPGGTYTATVTDGNGCTAVASGTIYEPPPIVVTFDVQGQCSPVGEASATASATGGTPPFTYEWSTGEQGPHVSNLTEGYYFVTVTDSLGCKKSATLAISDGTTLLVTATDDATCAGLDDGSAQAVATGGLGPLQFLWSDGQATPDATNLAPGSYTLLLTDGAGCQDSATVSIGADIVVELSSSATAAGCNSAALGTATVAVVSGGSAPYFFDWNDPLLQNTPTATGLADGSYTVVVTDAIGCTASTTATVQESDPLDLSLSFDNASCQNTFDGSATVGQLGANAVPPLTYAWSNGSTASFLENLLPGAYSLTVTDALQCTGSAAVDIPSDASVEALFTHDLTSCTGSTVSVFFDGSANFSPANAPVVAWQWQFYENADPLGAATEDVSLTTPDSVLTAVLIIEGATGCLDSVAATVATGNVLNLDLQYPSFACQSDTLQVLALANGSDSLVFLWESSSPGLFLLENGLPAAQFVAADTGSFPVTLTITNPLGCSRHDSLTLDFLGEHVAFDPALLSYRQCEGLTVDFTNANPGLAGAFEIFFDFPDTSASSSLTNPSYTYPDTGSYLVALVPLLPCLKDTFYLPVQVSPPAVVQFSFEKSPCSDTVTVSLTDESQVPGGAAGWSWQFSNGDSASLQNPVLVLAQSQNLVATLTVFFQNGCSANWTDSLEVPVFNQGFPDDSLALCPGLGSVPLNPDGDSTNAYLWSPPTGLSDPTYWNPTATVAGTTFYSVTITDSSTGETCTAVREVLVFLTENIGLQAPADVTTCDSLPQTLMAAASLSPVDFLWSSQPGFADTLSFTASLDVLPGEPTLFFVQATDSYGCSAIDSVLVGNYAVQVQLADFQKVCINTTPVVAVAGLQVGDVLSWSPYDPNTLPLAATDSFTATVANLQGCTTSATIVLQAVDVNLLFAVSPVLDTIVAGQSTQLEVVSELQHICTWSPDSSLDDAGDCTVVASPMESTTYTVTVQDPSSGCTASSTATVCVVSNRCDEPMIFVPKAFSPNGDGLNDVLYLRGFNVGEVVSFEVFDRWGQRVFTSNSPDEGWDGTLNGKEVAGDVFAYFLRVRCKVGEEFFTKGNVTMLR